MKRIYWPFLVAVTLGLSRLDALGCAACFGQSDSNMAKSLNASIFTLMGVVGVVLFGAATFFVFLAKRAAAASQSEQNPSTTN